MSEHPNLRTASPRAADDHENSLIVGPFAPILINGFRASQGSDRRNGKPQLTVVSGSAAYGAGTVTIGATNYTEVKTPRKISEKIESFLRSAVGPLLVFAAAALVAVTFSLAPAPDRPVFPAGPLSGYSLLHFPR